MLMRPDKKRLPIAFIGNGSAHDASTTYGATNVDIMLDFIVKGDIFREDVAKVILDYEDESDIPDD